MTIADARRKTARIEVTHPSNRRSSGRSPEAMTALAGRIRALQRSEPNVTGEKRSAAIAELTAAQLKLERLSLHTRRDDHDQTQVLADTFALAQDIDRLARLWPIDAAAHLVMATAHRHDRPRHLDPDRKAA